MKKSRMKFAAYLLVPIAIAGFYQFKISKFKGVKLVECYQVKSDLYIQSGERLTETMFTRTEVDESKIPKDYLKSLQDIGDKFALERMYAGDYLTQPRVADIKDWDLEEDRYLTLSSADSFSGNDIRPGDVIDILLYDSAKQGYSVEVQDLEVLDIRDADGIRYKDSVSANFVASKINFKSTNEDYKKILDKMANSQGKMQITVHGNRPKETKHKTSVDSNILSVK